MPTGRRETIEVTEEMIEAGVTAAWQDESPPAMVRAIVERVYRAMEAERLRTVPSLRDTEVPTL